MHSAVWLRQTFNFFPICDSGWVVTPVLTFPLIPHAAKTPCVNQNKALYPYTPHGTDLILCFLAVNIVIKRWHFLWFSWPTRQRVMKMHLMGVSSLFSALLILWVQIARMYLGTPPLVNTKVNYSRFSGLPRCKGSLWSGWLQRFRSDLHFLSYYHRFKNPHLKSKTYLKCCCNNNQILNILSYKPVWSPLVFAGTE